MLLFIFVFNFFLLLLFLVLYLALARQFILFIYLFIVSFLFRFIFFFAFILLCEIFSTGRFSIGFTAFVSIFYRSLYIFSIAALKESEKTNRRAFYECVYMYVYEPKTMSVNSIHIVFHELKFYGKSIFL